MSLRSALFLALVAAAPALASDGVLEINHTCATTTGCFPGDSAGYPVQITAAGSYRLTSNLTVPAGTNGIEVAGGVDLDLGGFEIAGPVSCLLGCPAPGPGSGIAPAPFGGNQCAVSNGKVRGFAEDGVRLGQQSEVRRVRVTDVARHGINLSAASFAAENLVNRIGQNGIQFIQASIAQSLYRDNAIATVGGQSVLEGRASGPNVCIDRLCGTTGNKLFYLTFTTHDGAAADAACAAGFHMASLWEMHDPSAFEYDTTRGFVDTDTGEGPTGNSPGWIRTGGGPSSISLVAGSDNCLGWSTAAASGERGSLVRLNLDWRTTTTTIGAANPWVGLVGECSVPARVWCVQN